MDLIWNNIPVFGSPVLLKCAKLQFFFSGSFCQVYRVTDEALIAETAVWSVFFLINIITALKVTQFSFSFAITAAGVVSCGGRRKSPRTSSIVQIILSDQRSYSEKSEFIIGLDLFSKRSFFFKCLELICLFVCLRL